MVPLRAIPTSKDPTSIGPTSPANPKIIPFKVPIQNPRMRTRVTATAHAVLSSVYSTTNGSAIKIAI